MNAEAPTEKLEKFEKIEIADYWLYEIEKRVKKTIEAAENVMELDEDDIKFILFSHALRMIGLGVIPADRSNEIDDLIVANNLHQ
jgi:hypothetical protein